MPRTLERIVLGGAVLLLAGTGCRLMADIASRRQARQAERARIAEVFDHEYDLRHDGLARNYKVHLPPSHDGKTQLPVVIALHGGFGTASAIEMQSRMSEQADRSGFIVAYPEGLGRKAAPRIAKSWNGGTCCDPAKERGVDDVGFISAMIDDLVKRHKIDRSRVYATGISNGAIMSYRLACDLSEKIAGIAPVAGPDATVTCKPAKPVSIIHFHGVTDPCSPFKGGPGGGCAARALGAQGKPIFDTASIPDIAKRWAERNGAPAEGKVTLRKGAATCTTYGPGREGSEVTLCAIDGGGHTWPGGHDNLPVSLVGNLTKDISANDLMWEFFKRHPRR